MNDDFNQLLYREHTVMTNAGDGRPLIGLKRRELSEVAMGSLFPRRYGG